MLETHTQYVKVLIVQRCLSLSQKKHLSELELTDLALNAYMLAYRYVIYVIILCHTTSSRERSNPEAVKPSDLFIFL